MIFKLAKKKVECLLSIVWPPRIGLDHHDGETSNQLAGVRSHVFEEPLVETSDVTLLRISVENRLCLIVVIEDEFEKNDTISNDFPASILKHWDTLRWIQLLVCDEIVFTL